MRCTINDIAIVTMGQSPKSEFYNSTGDGLPFLQGNRTFGRLYPTFDTYTTLPGFVLINVDKKASSLPFLGGSMITTS